MARIKVRPTGAALGAEVTGVDLTKPLDADTVEEIRSAWLDHLVLAFPGQPMTHDDLERFTRYFGPFGEAPFIAPLPDRPHIIEVKRGADEKASVFAAAWASGPSNRATRMEEFGARLTAKPLRSARSWPPTVTPRASSIACTALIW